MTTIKTTILMCEGCGKKFYPTVATSQVRLRREARLNGWCCNSQINQDTCPECLAKLDRIIKSGKVKKG